MESRLPQLIERDRRLIANALRMRYTPVVIDRGDGAAFFDPDGKRYLDFGAGWSIAHLGYSNQHVRDAINRQLATSTSLALI